MALGSMTVRGMRGAGKLGEYPVSQAELCGCPVLPELRIQTLNAPQGIPHGVTLPGRGTGRLQRWFRGL